eukprot:gene24703-biopygen19445
MRIHLPVTRAFSAVSADAPVSMLGPGARRKDVPAEGRAGLLSSSPAGTHLLGGFAGARVRLPLLMYRTAQSSLLPSQQVTQSTAGQGLGGLLHTLAAASMAFAALCASSSSSSHASTA